jgi:hypothetical protein
MAANNNLKSFWRLLMNIQGQPNKLASEKSPYLLGAGSL